jgi:hypothetical protein
MIRRWFAMVREHHAELLAEWESARYYRQVLREGKPTGTYIMLFESHGRDGRRAYKERRKEWSGPYELFEPGTVVAKYWEPQETERWFEFAK